MSTDHNLTTADKPRFSHCRTQVNHRARVYGVTCQGTIDEARALPHARATCRQAAEMGYALLFDLREAQTDLAPDAAHRLLAITTNLWAWKFSLALVGTDSGTLEWLRFLAGVAPNAQVAARVFEDADGALKWATEAAEDSLEALAREGIKVLVVDDEPDILATTEIALSRAGFQTFTAASEEECMDVALREIPDLILLDVVLGPADGREVCRRLKAEPSLRTTFVALASGQRTDVEDQVAGIAAGAEGYIPRPVGPKELTARVEVLLRRRELDLGLGRHGQEDGGNGGE